MFLCWQEIILVKKVLAVINTFLGMQLVMNSIKFYLLMIIENINHMIFRLLWKLVVWLIKNFVINMDEVGVTNKLHIKEGIPLVEYHTWA